MATDRETPASNLLQVPQNDEEVPPSQDEPHTRFARKSTISKWVPEVDPAHPRAESFMTRHSRRHVVLWTCTLVAFIIFLVNLTATLVFGLKYPPANGIGTIFTGSHLRSTVVNSGVHVLINVLSTLLLGASNMCMQLCVAPTRKELDGAHAKCTWLDIGAPSMKNLPWINWRRIPLVVILGLTSIPLHFLYNSAVFPSLAVNTYEWILVKPEFFEADAYWNYTSTWEWENAIPPEQRCSSGSVSDTFDTDTQEPWVNRIVNETRENKGTFRKISNLECLIVYNNAFGKRSDLILVTNDESDNTADPYNTLLYMGQWGATILYNPADWLIFWRFGDTKHLTTFDFVGAANSAYFDDINYFQGNTLEEKRRNRETVAQNWHIQNYTVDHCLMSESNANLYTVSYSLSIMIVICVANFCKFLGILATAIWYSRHKEPPLSILGDAIASFLESEDMTTRRLGVCSVQDIIRREKIGRNCEVKDKTRRWRFPPPPLLWEQKNLRWFHGASKGRWGVAILLCLTVLGVAMGFLASAIGGIISGYSARSPTLAEKIAYVYSTGFGQPNINTLILWLGMGADASLLYRHVFFANSWQFAISFLYLFVNALVTSLLVGNEWAHYARHRKPLRVSAPVGIQRGSFFISMPYKYGVPLMLSVAILHWTVSQAVFVVKIASYFSDGSPDLAASVSSVGFSPAAVTVSVVLGMVIITGVCCLALKKYKKGMPLASTCSAAISAACHPPADDYDARLFPVMWGVVETNSKGFVHCSFTTAMDVRPLGEPDDWSEKKEAQEKKDRKIRQKQAKKAKKEAKPEQVEVQEDERSIGSSDESEIEDIEDMRIVKAKNKLPKSAWSRKWREFGDFLGSHGLRWRGKKYKAVEQQQREEGQRVDIVAAWPALEGDDDT